MTFAKAAAINADTVDMSVLAPALNSYSNFNGVLYISDITNADSYGNTSSTDAIRIDKGGTLPNAGLTLASDGAVYVQGDYNTGTTYVSGTATPLGSARLRYRGRSHPIHRRGLCDESLLRSWGMPLWSLSNNLE